jgi:hypothetical protein
MGKGKQSRTGPVKAQEALKGSPLGILSRILTLVLLGLAAVLVTGSLYGLLALKKAGRTDAEGGAAGSGKPPPAGASQGVPQGEEIFTNIGRIRVSVGEAEPLTVVLSISFPYFPGDKAFSE